MDWIASPSVLTDTISRVRDVRSLGLDVGVDFHGRLHKGMAKQLAKLLQPLQPMFIEEPLLPTQPEEIADLAQMVSTPIALGERLYTRHDFRPYLERRAIDIAQPDVSVLAMYYNACIISYLGLALRRHKRTPPDCVIDRDIRCCSGSPLSSRAYCTSSVYTG